MALRIACDLDGVLADMESELVRQAYALFGDSLTEFHSEGRATVAPAPTLSSLRLTSRQARQLWRHVAGITNFWETLPEIEPGMVARLSVLTAEHGWDVFFVTKRPETAGATAQRQTQRWLDTHGFSFPSVLVAQGSRGRIASALEVDVVIDDLLENCIDVSLDSAAKPIFVWRGEMARLPAAARGLRITVVESVSECLDVLKHSDSSAARKPSVVGKIMQRLGFREAPGS